MLTTKLLAKRGTQHPIRFLFSPIALEMLQTFAKNSERNMKKYSHCRVDNVNKNMAHTTASQIALKECYTRNLCHEGKREMRDES